MKTIAKFYKNEKGDAVVEATFLFPIIIMIFAGLVWLAITLPQAAILQRAVQYAATSLAPEQTDTGYTFNVDKMQAEWDMQLYNTWMDAITYNYDWSKNGNPLLQRFLWFIDYTNVKGRANEIVEKVVNSDILNKGGKCKVDVDYRRTFLYSELEVTAAQVIKTPINLSFVGFPSEITITQSAVCATKDGDSFLRNVDDAVAYHGIVEKMVEISDYVINLIIQVIGIS